MKEDLYLDIDKLHIKGPTLTSIPPTENDEKKQKEYREWLEKVSKREVIICCENTQSVIRKLIEIGITQQEFDIVKNSLDMHPLDRFGRNKFRIGKTYDIDLDALINEVFEVSTFLEKKEAQDLFLKEFYSLVQKENKNSFWALTLDKFNKKWNSKKLSENYPFNDKENQYAYEKKSINNFMKSVSEEFEWDFFISHASEDKESVASPLYEILSKKGIKVWLDKHETVLGDSLRRKLDEGLAKSRFGIVILSEDFFQKEWTKKELDALVSREDGIEKVIIPVLHKINKSIVSKYSPLLSDKISISTDNGLEQVADEIGKVLKKHLDREVLFFSDSEILSLKEAIKYSRAREGNFSSVDPLVEIISMLNSELGANLGNYNSAQLSVILKAVDDNIRYLNQYKYDGLPDDAALNNKQNILVPLFELRSKISKAIKKSS